MRSTAPPRSLVRGKGARLESGRPDRRAAVRYPIAMQLQFSVPGQPADAPVGSYAGHLIDISREEFSSVRRYGSRWGNLWRDSSTGWRRGPMGFI